MVDTIYCQQDREGITETLRKAQGSQVDESSCPFSARNVEHGTRDARSVRQ